MLRRLVNGSMKECQSNRDGWSFGLTIRFGLYETRLFRISFTDNSLEIGVRAARLDFNLTDALMPDEDWAHDDVTNENVKLTVEKTLEASNAASKARHDGSSIDLGGLASLSKNLEIRLSNKLSTERSSAKKLDRSEKQQTVESYNHERHALIAIGSEKHPAWQVQSTLDNKVLLGTAVKSSYFARVTEAGGSPRVALTATISPTDIFVRDRTGAFEPVNKRLLAMVRIRRELCRNAIPLDEHSIELDGCSSDV